MNPRDWNRIRGMVQAMTGVRHTHRYRKLTTGLNGSGTNGGLTSFLLMTCDDDPDYDENFDAAGAAPECSPGSRLLGIDLQVTIVSSTSNQNTELLLLKDPDAIFGATVSPASLFENDVSTTTIPLRKYTLAYSRHIVSSSGDKINGRIRVSSRALARAGVMHDGDSLKLQVLQEGATGGNITITGRIWTRTG